MRTKINKWKDVSTQRKFFDDIAKKFNISKKEDWYKISASDISLLGGRTLMENYNFSTFNALSSVYSEFDWKPWKFYKKPPNLWKDKKNHVQFFDWLGKQLNISQWQDWYKFDKSVVEAQGGKELLKDYYGGSFIESVTSIYSNFPWDITMFSYYPENFWKEKKNQRKFFEIVSKRISIKEWKDWYSVSSKDLLQFFPTILDKILMNYEYSSEDALISNFPEFNWRKIDFKEVKEKHRAIIEQFHSFSNSTIDEIYNFDFSANLTGDVGKIIHQYYDGHLINAILSIYKEFDFKIWKFKYPTHAVFVDRNYHRLYFESISKDLNHTSYTDWYSVDIKDILYRGGETILHHYFYSPSFALITLFPEFDWKLNKFNSSLNTQRTLFDNIGKKLGVKSLDDWYNFTSHDLSSLGIETALRMFKGSLLTALKSVYPEHNWRPWKFFFLPNGYWDNKDNVREAVESTAKEFHIQQLDDWKGVTNAQMIGAGLGSLIRKHKGTLNLMKVLYPEHNWDLNTPSHGNKIQQEIVKIVNEIL